MLNDIPREQRRTKKKKGEFEVSHEDWATKLKDGIAKWLQSGRIFTPEAKADYQGILDIICRIEAQPFAWDTALYDDINEEKSSPPPLNLDDHLPIHPYGTFPQPDDQSLLESDFYGIPRPQWITGNFYMCKLEQSPYYIFAKYCFLFGFN